MEEEGARSAPKLAARSRGMSRSLGGEAGPEREGRMNEDGRFDLKDEAEAGRDG
jgi:hypothetical protein